MIHQTKNIDFCGICLLTLSSIPNSFDSVRGQADAMSVIELFKERCYGLLKLSMSSKQGSM